MDERLSGVFYYLRPLPPTRWQTSAISEETVARKVGCLLTEELEPAFWFMFHLFQQGDFNQINFCNNNHFFSIFYVSDTMLDVLFIYIFLFNYHNSPVR